MTKGIYSYYDSKKGKIVYIGRDSNIHKNARHKAHMSKSRRNDQPFHSILQDNTDRYYYDVIIEGEFDNDMLNALERYYINIYNTFEDGFNFTCGGENNYEFSEESKKKMSESHKGKVVSAETRDKISKYMSNNRVGENNPRYGKHNTKEHNNKISKSLTGRTRSKEHCNNLSKANTYKLPIIRKYNNQNRWLCFPRYKDGDKTKRKTIRRKSLTDCIVKVEEFLNSEQNNLGLIIPIIELDIEEDL